jgi:hypothetical protein
MTEILEYPRGRSGSSVLKLIQIPVAGSALLLLPMALWCLTHQYHGLVGDSELYEVQALARNDPSLARVVFLSGASQDRFTVFSPIYALFIRSPGLRTAAISLLVLFKMPLTKDRLVQLFADPALGFVVAKEHVGLGSQMRRDRPGAWNGWNLLDCRRIDYLKVSG